MPGTRAAPVTPSDPTYRWMICVHSSGTPASITPIPSTMQRSDSARRASGRSSYVVSTMKRAVSWVMAPVRVVMCWGTSSCGVPYGAFSQKGGI